MWANQRKDAIGENTKVRGKKGVRKIRAERRSYDD
jgi:hypothetical protein